MSTSVNLATQDIENKKGDVYKRYAGWFFILCILLSVIVFSYSLFLRLQVADIQSREDALQSQIRQNREKISDYIYLNNKITYVSSVLNDRSPFNTRLSSFLSEVPNDVEVSRIDISSNVMSFRLVSFNLALLQELINTRLPRYVTENELQTVNITSFGLNTQNSQYYANISVEYSR